MVRSGVGGGGDVRREDPSGGRLLVTVEEAARLTGLGRTTAYALVASGEWASISVGRAVRIPLSDLLSWVESRKERGTRGSSTRSRS